MKVALIGASGFVGGHILNELKQRGHNITAIVRNAPANSSENVKWVAADVHQTTVLANILGGHDVVVSAFNAGWTNPNLHADFLKGARAIQEAVKASGVSRYITIGGAGSLYVAPDLQLVDAPDFPEEYKSAADAARIYLNDIRKEKQLDWAFFSPAIEMHQGITTGRTGTYRLGLESPVFDADGRSILSGEDVGVVIADEVENPKHHQQRFTAAY